MLKHCYPLLVVLALVSCARTPSPTESLQQAPETPPAIAKKTETVQVPMSPLDPAVQQDELASLPDVWQRIRQQIQIKVPQRADIKKEIAFFAGKQKFFSEVGNRAEPYLYMIVTELEKRQMPVELALLPIVESGYNPAALGRGPAGLWQMVPQTARNFGLNIQPGYDGRKDPLSSTMAVLDYLQHLHDTLGHDWLTAVAAYNTGEGRIMAAIERNRAQGKPTDYWSLKIPARHVQTMPKWLAMISMVKDPAAYQIKLPRIANSPAIGLTRIAGAVELQQAADLAGIPLRQLKNLNPSFRLATTPVGKEFPLILPLLAMDNFEQQKHLLKKVAVVQKSESKTSRYKVKSGDSLGAIAARFKTNVATLRQLNQLKTDRLQPGQFITLPASKNQSKRTASRTSYTYQVKSGDNLWTIAKTLRIDSEELRLYNKLPPKAQLKPGQHLRIPVSTTTLTKTPTGTKKAAQSYIVKKGDSLDRIARQHKIKLADLLKWNQLQADSTLKPGQQLRLVPFNRQS
jgi:membrane-bound lytic murein transglycosylase D